MTKLALIAKSRDLIKGYEQMNMQNSMLAQTREALLIPLQTYSRPLIRRVRADKLSHLRRGAGTHATRLEPAKCAWPPCKDPA